MLLSSNVIRNTSIGESKKIITKGEIVLNNELEITKEEMDILHDEVSESTEIIEEMLKNAENESRLILEKAEEEKNKILEEARNEASIIRQKSYKEGYEKGIAEGNKEAKNLISQAEKRSDEIILNANTFYKEYLSSKENDIKKMIIDGYEKIFLKAFNEEDILDNILRSQIEEITNCEVFYIKVNKKYYSHLIEMKDKWKQLFHGVEINIIEDENIEDGIGIIVAEKGKVEINLTSSLDEIRNVIENY